MADIIIRNIENYDWSIVNGDLRLTSKRDSSGQSDDYDAEDIRIRNIENYGWSFVNGDLRLTSKRDSSGQSEEHAAMYAAEASESSTEQVHYVSKEGLIASVTSSTIVTCLVLSGTTIISTSLAYRSIVKDILHTMTRRQLIEDKDRPGAKNYWLVHEDADLDTENTVWQSRKNNTLEFRGVNSMVAINELLHLVNLNQLTIQLTILTNKGDLIHYKA
jgi:hypothetical protein